MSGFVICWAIKVQTPDSSTLLPRVRWESRSIYANKCFILVKILFWNAYQHPNCFCDWEVKVVWGGWFRRWFRGRSIRRVRIDAESIKTQNRSESLLLLRRSNNQNCDSNRFVIRARVFRPRIHFDQSYRPKIELGWSNLGQFKGDSRFRINRWIDLWITFWIDLFRQLWLPLITRRTTCEVRALYCCSICL
jgi:hypothetical protein